jgi:hypothetical protein
MTRVGPSRGVPGPDRVCGLGVLEVARALRPVLEATLEPVLGHIGHRRRKRWIERIPTDATSSQICAACHCSRVAVQRVGVVTAGTYQMPPPAGIFLSRAYG